MTPSLGAILAVLGILWAIVQVIVQASAKKKEQERLAALARRRREEAALVSQQGGVAAGPASPRSDPRAAAVARSVPPVSPATSQLDELRRRRAAQLEDLRRRKQQAEGKQVQARIAPASSSSTTSQAPAMRRGPSPLQPPPAPLLRNQPSAPRPSPGLPGPARPSRSGRPLVAPPMARPPLTAAAPPSVDENVEGPARPLKRSAAPPPRAQHRPPSQSRLALVLDRAALRRAIILKEILDRPVALRDPI